MKLGLTNHPVVWIIIYTSERNRFQGAWSMSHSAVYSDTIEFIGKLKHSAQSCMYCNFKIIYVST